MNKISTRLKRTKIIDTCFTFIGIYGAGYIGDDFSINHLKDVAEENMVVKVNSRTVLHCRSTSSGLATSEYNPIIGNFHVLEYHKGKWENDIIYVLKHGEKEMYKKVPKNHVSSITLHTLKKNFDI